MFFFQANQITFEHSNENRSIFKARACAVTNNQLPLAEAGLFPLLRHHGRICTGHLPCILKCERTYMETNLKTVKESAIWSLTPSLTSNTFHNHPLWAIFLPYFRYSTGAGMQLTLIRASLQTNSSPIREYQYGLYRVLCIPSVFSSITFSEESLTCIEGNLNWSLNTLLFCRIERTSQNTEKPDST